jgi:hypothetical protein
MPPPTPPLRQADVGLSHGGLERIGQLISDGRVIFAERRFEGPAAFRRADTNHTPHIPPKLWAEECLLYASRPHRCILLHILREIRTLGAFTYL